MGMEDRDYFQSRTTRSGSAGGPQAYRHHSFARRAERDGSSKFWLLLLLVPVWFWVGNDKLQQTAQPIQTQPPPALLSTAADDQIQQEVELIPGGLIIKADSTGHFRGQALINDVQMPFLIDTGATQTVIPEAMAVHSGLPVGRQIQNTTAGGEVISHLTRLSMVKLGNAELRNLQAIINPYIDEVLIGMNTLKYFQMTQNKDTLTLVATHDVDQVETLEKDLPVQMPPPAFMAETQAGTSVPGPVDQQPKLSKGWKKTMICDANQRCRPSYGDR